MRTKFGVDSSSRFESVDTTHRPPRTN